MLIVRDTSVRAITKAEAVDAWSLSDRPQVSRGLVVLGHCPCFFKRFAIVSCATSVSILNT